MRHAKTNQIVSLKPTETTPTPGVGNKKEVENSLVGFSSDENGMFYISKTVFETNKEFLSKLPESERYYDDAPLLPTAVMRPPCKEVTEWYYCSDCHQLHSKPHTCNQRYGNCCYEERRKRTFTRLIEAEIKTTRLIHIVIGFKKNSGSPNKLNKKEMEKTLTKLHNKVRKKLNYEWSGVRIFDLADDGHYEHFHYALFPEKSFMNGRSLEIDVVKIRTMLKKVSDGSCEVVKVLGFRSKRNLFSYFAKRIAGRYGHKNNVFFLEDVMSYESYKEDFYNVRSLVKIGNPEGLSCINAPSPIRCPYCGSEFCYKIAILPNGEKFKPPPWMEEEILASKTKGLRGFV